jgi:hypothetical protein
MIHPASETSGVRCKVYLLLGQFPTVAINTYFPTHVAEHMSCHKGFIAYKASFRWEFRIRFPPSLQLTVFHRRVSMCRPPASKRSSYLLKKFLDTRLISCFEVLAGPVRILSCSECGFFHSNSVFLCPHK